MDTQAGDAAQDNTSCVLQHNKCKEHYENCPHVWIMVPQLHNFLHQLPGELQRMIIAETVVPQPQCIKHVFGHCYNPWECQDGAHTFDSVEPRVTPSTCYTSKCQLVHEEGHKAFFQNNVFIFKSRVRVLFKRPPTGSEAIREWFHKLDFNHRSYRDYRATRLLEFVDSPEWKCKGSELFRNYGNDSSYQHIDEYRHIIRHLVFRMGDNEKPYVQRVLHPNWAWALKVDWKTLPGLQTLVPDLKGYSYCQLQTPALPQELFDEQLGAGAKRMECLNLKSLIIYGLCSGPDYWGKKQHKRKMEKLFLPALAQSGKLELCDEERFVEW
jgi:hypothetical protein